MSSEITVKDFINDLPDDRKLIVEALHKRLHAALPKHKVSVKKIKSLTFLNYGNFHYVYKTGLEGDCPPVCLASNKQYVSVYIMASADKGYLAEVNAKRLGEKVKVGKSCIRFKKLEDINLDVLVELAQEACRQHPQDSIWHQ